MYILKFCEDITAKKTLIIIFNKKKQSGEFRGKKQKVLLHKHSFLPAMHGWGISPNNKRSSKPEKENVCKTDLFYQNKHDHQLFLQIFSQVFEK